MNLKVLLAALVLSLSMTACLKDKSAEQAPAEQTEMAAPAPTENGAVPAEAPAEPTDSGDTQSAQ